MPLWFAILACTSGTAGGPFEPATAGQASEPSHPDAAYTAEEAAAAMTEGIRFGLPSGTGLWAVWTDFLSHGDETCPGAEAVEQNSLAVFDPYGCVASSGYWFQGAGGGGVGMLDTDMDGTAKSYVEMFKADGSMRTPQGDTFEFGGAIELIIQGDLDVAEVEAEVLGTYAYPLAEEPWLVHGVSTAVYYEGTREAGIWRVTLDGGVTVAGESVGFDGLSVNGDCGLTPTGKVSVRDAVGYWYELEYDEATCDGCGEVVFDHNQPLGRACADVSPGVLYAFGATDQNLMATWR